MKLQTLYKIIPFLALLLIISPSNATGYSGSSGIEDGDIMDIEYTGRYADNQEVFETRRVNFNIKLGEGGIIEGFYDGLLGLKVGDSAEINVPIGKGYTQTTAPSPELADRALIFEVFIHTVVVNVRDNDDDSSGLSGTIGTILTVIAVITVAALVLIAFYALRSKAISADCVHCESMGRKNVTAEGKCSKCGQPYCRASFSRGCPNCKGNSFIPN